MLLVQKYLKNLKSVYKDVQLCLDQLESTLGVKSKVNSDGRVLLDYCQINSPKFHPIVRECRGLVLNTNFDLVARSFPRFYNLGEVNSVTNDEDFDWSQGIRVQEKVDGSLINLYFHDGKWKISTRFSFCENECSFGLSWQDVFELCLKQHNISLDKLDTKKNYLLEMCTPYNQVVAIHKTPTLYLLSVFSGERELDYTDYVGTTEFKDLSLLPIYTREECYSYISAISEECPTFEGLVVTDYSQRRVKIKSSKYLTLHRTKSGITTNSDIVELVVNNEQDEFLTYFPEFRTRVDDIAKQVENIKQEVISIWNANKHITDRKTFALTILPQTKYTAPLFNVYQRGGDVNDYLTVEYLQKFF